MWYEILPRVLNMSLTAGIIILFVCVCRLLLKRAPKIYSYALWSVVLFRLLCPVSLSAPVSLLGMFHAPVAEVSTWDTQVQTEGGRISTGNTSAVEYIPSQIVREEYPEITLPVGGSNGVVAGTINQALPQGEEQLGAESLEAPISLLTYLWMFGILVMLGSGTLSYIKLRHQLDGAMLLERNIYLADHIPGPFVIGFRKPKIYLPSGLQEKEHPYIILHEQHHIRRGDHFFKVLGYLALSIHWFNPLVWIAFRLFVKDMEMSCDEAVLSKLGEEIRADYSASLLRFATGQRSVYGTPLAFGEGETKGRIRNLSVWKKPGRILSAIAVVLCVLAILFCFFNPTFVKEALHMEGAKDTLPELTPDKLEALYQQESERSKAEEIYAQVLPRLKELSRVIYVSSLKTDTEELVDENGMIYFRVLEEEYTSIEDIEKLMASVLTKEYINDHMSWVLGKERPLFKELNGQLCIAMKDAIGIGIPTQIQSIYMFDETQLQFQGYNEDNGYFVSLVKQGDKWLMNELGIIDDEPQNQMPQENANVKTEKTTISGSFTVTVRDIIPDYTLDDITPTVAVVTQFQGNPFTLNVGEEIGKQLKKSETYVFTIQPLEVDGSKEELQSKTLASLVQEYSKLTVVDFRLAQEQETGVDSLNLTIGDIVTNPQPTEEPAEESNVEWSEKVSWGDLDGDGTEEYIMVERGDFLKQNVVGGRITMYVNNEPVYQYTEELWITGVGDKGYLDLNGDGQEEIFVAFYPAVNSMPLAEWFVLERTENGWERLEMYHEEGNMSANAFPISVVLKKKDFDLAIRCEGWDGEIVFDGTEHYARMKEELEAGNDAYNVFAESQYEAGDVVGETLPWGVWEIQAGTYEGQNCLIALHGLCGPAGKYDYYGEVSVYFDYDEAGKIKILNVEFSQANE